MMGPVKFMWWSAKKMYKTEMPTKYQSRKHELQTDYQDHFEYFGNTEIERIRKKGEKTIGHDWIIFDTVDEVMEFFNDCCGEFVDYYA
jgi:hypothetical protein